MADRTAAPNAALASWTLELSDERGTDALARELATAVQAGDLLTLSGDLGAGKTTFARALIRLLAGDPQLEVPSPTFTLMQTYDTARFPVVHADLYRINHPQELTELGWDEAAQGSLVLVEWPERAGPLITADRLDISFALRPESGDTARGLTLTGTGHWAARIAKARALHELLADAGWSAASRSPMQGDASTRSYERLTQADGASAVLMIAPRRPDGPPVRLGKPYSEIAHLAESVDAFVAMAGGLRRLGFSAPEILKADLDAGLLLIEDLGQEGVATPDGPVPERYGEAAAVLAHLHTQTLPAVLPVLGDIRHAIPPYDLDALLIEAELLLDWYLPRRAGRQASGSARAAFVSLWRTALDPVASAPPTWVLRDYHSPNLLWLPERDGLARIGLIDFQDAVLGHAAYDVVSLLQDARLDVPEDLELKLLGHYARLRTGVQPGFAMQPFAAAYAVMGAQRATKILGIFARLDKRDGKPAYLRHLPRIERYLKRNLAHPVLSDLRLWYETHLPELFAAA
jgi:N-acetylmuramate 1-kinase